MNEHEQNSLSGHNARWNILVDGVPVSLYRTTPNGEFLDVNLAMVEMFGYPSREELLAHNPVDLYVFPEEREHWKTLIAREGVVRNFEFQIRRYDGTILWLSSSARAVKDEQGRVIYYEGSLEDITERKRMEAEREHLLQAAHDHLRRADALRQAGAALTSTLNYEEVLKRILEQMSQVVPHDTANIMLIKGEQAQVIQGHGYEDFDPQLVITTLTLDMSKTPILQRMQATGQPEAIPYVEHNTEWVYARPEHIWIKSYAGTPIIIRNQVLGFLNVNSGIPGYYAQIHAEQLKAFADQAAIAIENAGLYQQSQAELAERKRVEAELRVYQEQLEERVKERTRKLAQATREAEEARAAAEAANQAKSTFLANMNHELRTPLNSILGFAQALERDSTLMGTQREHIEIIRRNGVHLLTLLDDILDFAKIDINRLELFSAEFVLSDMLSQLVDMTHLKAEHKGLSFVCEISDTLPHIVSGDQKRLRQILLNLLGNAVKYTEQGKVTFRVTKVPKVPKMPKVEDPNNQSSIVNLQFSIEDTGPGIPPDQLETIFQPFQQADPHKLEEGRIGLGLAISKRLVEMMGSQLQVTSTVGQGSTFWFDVELPVIDTTRPDVPQSRQEEASWHLSQETLTTALAALPAEWLAALKRGAEETDVEVLREVIAQIRERNAPLADALASLAEDFEYDEILAILQHQDQS